MSESVICDTEKYLYNYIIFRDNCEEINID